MAAQTYDNVAVDVAMLPNLHLQIYRPNVGTLNYINVGKKTKKKTL